MGDVLVGLVSAGIGFVSGLLVPWIKWEVEKRKQLLASRREAVKGWRAAVGALQHDAANARIDFLSSAEYASLRAHLEPEIIKKVEAPRTIYAAGGRGGHVRNHMLLDEITRIEKKWGLV